MQFDFARNGKQSMDLWVGPGGWFPMPETSQADVLHNT